MTDEDHEAARHLVGFCDKCGEWHKFEVEDLHKGCPTCGYHFSYKHGLQITTQRTFTGAKYKKVIKKESGA